MSDDKTQAALDLLSQGLTLKQAAAQLGYKKPDALGQLLRRRGYRWDADQGIYVPTGKESRTVPSQAEMLTPEAKELLQRAREVLALLNSGAGAMADSLSSPLLKGHLLTKSLRLPHPLCEAIEGFASDKRLTQKAIFESALIEFLERRGVAGDVSS